MNIKCRCLSNRARSFSSRIVPIGEKYDDRTRRGAIVVLRKGRRGFYWYDVLRRVESGVNPSAPGTIADVIFTWQREIQGLPIRIENKVEDEFLSVNVRSEGNAVRRIAPVGLVKFDAVPRFAGAP